MSLRFAGIAMWCVYASALSAERLRAWPFKHIGTTALESLNSHA
jgi:hypothetical protein